MSASYLRTTGIALVALLVGALPASAEITGVTFKTSRNVGFM